MANDDLLQTTEQTCSTQNSFKPNTNEYFIIILSRSSFKFSHDRAVPPVTHDVK